MTFKEMLTSIEESIRSDIPRLMELTIGCRLEYSDSYNSDLIRIIGDSHRNTFYVIDEFYEVSEYDKDYLKSYKVIGHDIMLNDVLEWMKLNGFSVEFHENGNFHLYSSEMYEFVSWNLPSPYLKDQSLELIKLMYNINKKK